MSTPKRICADCSASISARATRCKSCVNRRRWADPADPRRAALIARNARADAPYRDREWLRVRYEDEGMTLREIADEAEAALRTVARWRRYHGIPVRFDRRNPTPAGPAHFNWRGCTICPECSGLKGHKSARCRACSARHRAETGLADVMYLVRQWSATHWRPAIYERDGYACQCCGDTRGGNLEAHHKIHLSRIVTELREALEPDLSDARGRYAFIQATIADDAVRSLDNGVTLCIDCHLAAHVAEGWPYHRPPRQKGGEATYVAV